MILIFQKALLLLRRRFHHVHVFRRLFQKPALCPPRDACRDGVFEVRVERAVHDHPEALTTIVHRRYHREPLPRAPLETGRQRTSLRSPPESAASRRHPVFQNDDSHVVRRREHVRLRIRHPQLRRSFRGQRNFKSELRLPRDVHACRRLRIFRRRFQLSRHGAPRQGEQARRVEQQNLVEPFADVLHSRSRGHHRLGAFLPRRPNSL